MKAFIKSAIQALRDGARQPVVGLDSGTAQMLADHLEQLSRVLAGRSGRGHFLTASGQLECPHCNHPNRLPWHTVNCPVGEMLGTSEG